MIFAIDNGEFSYTRMADVAAGLVRKFLDIPTTIITDKPFEMKYATDQKLIQADTYTNRQIFDHTTYKSIKWFNHSRPDVYELSPYEQTLLIDADYFLFNNSHKNLFELNEDFLCYQQIHDPTNMEKFVANELINNHSIKNAWATVCYFKKSDRSKAIFDMMKHVRDNYEYYATLIGVPAVPYRNDYALAIALHTLSGYGTNLKYLPGKMTTLSVDVKLDRFDPNKGIIFAYEKNSKKYKGYLKDANVHIMSKWHLQDEKILTSIEEWLN